MEKYSQWRDPGTGIQPFLPPVVGGFATQDVGFQGPSPLLLFLIILILLSY